MLPTYYTNSLLQPSINVSGLCLFLEFLTSFINHKEKSWWKIKQKGTRRLGYRDIIQRKAFSSPLNLSIYSTDQEISFY
jgi:hypothetical protein